MVSYSEIPGGCYSPVQGGQNEMQHPLKIGSALETTRPFLVVAGIHGAGKSTATKHLSSLGYFVHAEIGWALRQQQIHLAHKGSTLSGPNLEWFDKLIFDAELKRDRFLQEFTELPHCVETWHIGNLAYAIQRSPKVVSKLEKVLLQQVQALKPTIIHLTISEGTFCDRCSLPDLPTELLLPFYLNIDRCIAQLISQYQLRAHVVSNDEDSTVLYQKLEKIVNNHRRPQNAP